MCVCVYISLRNMDVNLLRMAIDQKKQKKTKTKQSLLFIRVGKMVNHSNYIHLK